MNIKFKKIEAGIYYLSKVHVISASFYDGIEYFCLPTVLLVSLVYPYHVT